MYKRAIKSFFSSLIAPGDPRRSDCWHNVISHCDITEEAENKTIFKL